LFFKKRGPDPDHHSFIGEVPAVKCPTSLLDKARALGPVRVAVACADAAMPLESCRTAVDAGIMVPVLCGDPERIKSEAQKIGWAVDGFDIVAADGEEAGALAAAQTVREGRAGVLMKGQLHTDVFMKAALNKEVGLRGAGRFVHVFHITPPHNDMPILISDGAVNVAPDFETRKVAVQAVLDVSSAVGIANPKVAILSATEEPIPSVPSAIAAAELVEWARTAHPEAIFSGPLALDLILSKASARIKSRDSDPVTGAADAIIVPDIVAGNVLFKAMVYLCGGCAAGVVLGGRAPIVLTSRADPPEARLASLALARLLSS
jgi:phosphate acetyltransferase